VKNYSTRDEAVAEARKTTERRIKEVFCPLIKNDCVLRCASLRKPTARYVEGGWEPMAGYCASPMVRA